jgi:hypothetical protein
LSNFDGDAHGEDSDRGDCQPAPTPDHQPDQDDSDCPYADVDNGIALWQVLVGCEMHAAVGIDAFGQAALETTEDSARRARSPVGEHQGRVEQQRTCAKHSGENPQRQGRSTLWTLRSMPGGAASILRSVVPAAAGADGEMFHGPTLLARCVGLGSGSLARDPLGLGERYIRAI